VTVPFFVTAEDIQSLRARTIGKACRNLCSGTGAVLENRTYRVCNCAAQVLQHLQLIGAGVPKKYWEFTLAHLQTRFQETNKVALATLYRYIDDLDNMVNHGCGVYIQGKSGLAKSALGYFVLRRGIALGRVCFTIRMSQLTKLFFESLQDPAKKHLLDWIREDVELLMIDEIEKDYRVESTGTFSGTQINEFFGDIYDRQKALIVTSNKSKRGLKGVHAENVVDRLEELIDIVFTGESFRAQDAALTTLITAHE